MMPYNNHSFVILAYKESPFLEDCIISLKNQSLESNIIIATSTPNDFISAVAKKHSLEIFVNSVNKGIASDWSFAYEKAQTDYVTLAHQDDLYEPQYTQLMMDAANYCKTNLISFCNYTEIREHGEIKSNLNLIIKKLMILPYFLFSKNLRSKILKRYFLSLGSAICCPSVMYHKKYIGDFSFSQHYSINLDWEAWLRLAMTEGTFTYINRFLMKHRVHEDSETTAGIKDGIRQYEDLRILAEFWPGHLAKFIAKFYALSYNSNRSISQG